MAERIEALIADHLGECTHLLVVAFNAERWNASYTSDTARKQLAWYLSVPGCAGFVSISGGVSAFAVGYREPTDVGNVFNLSIFCVRPDVQRRGVGTRLLRHLERRLSEAGVKTIYLGTRKGTPAEYFYEKHCYGASTEDIEMRRDLGKPENVWIFGHGEGMISQRFAAAVLIGREADVPNNDAPREEKEQKWWDTGYFSWSNRSTRLIGIVEAQQPYIVNNLSDRKVCNPRR